MKKQVKKLFLLLCAEIYGRYRLTMLWGLKRLDGDGTLGWDWAGGGKLIVYVNERLRLRRPPFYRLSGEAHNPVSRLGCGIEAFRESKSGRWLVTNRNSAQGEWGYDVYSTKPFERCGGVYDCSGYMLQAPVISEDDRFVVGCYGLHWTSSWWAPDGEDNYTPADGGKIVLGTVFVHRLCDHQVARHDLIIDLPEGWVPEDPYDPHWLAVFNLRIESGRIRMTLPGEIEFTIDERFSNIRDLPVPDPAGGGKLMRVDANQLELDLEIKPVAWSLEDFVNGN